MRKCLAWAVLFGMLSAAFCADAPELKVHFAAVRNDIKNQWGNIPSGRPPQLIVRKSAAAGETVLLHVLCSGYTVRDGKAALSLKFKAVDPTGKVRLEEPEFSSFGSVPAAEKMLVISRRSLRTVFAPDDPQGNYLYQVTVRDDLSGKTVSAEWKLENTGPLKIAPGAMEEKELSRYLQTYYLCGRPELAVKAFRGMLAQLPAIRKKKGRNCNISHLTAAFAFILADNPVLDPVFRALRDSLSGDDLEVLLAVECEASLLRETPQKSDRLSSRYRVNYAEQPEQIDVLWSEFLIRGNYEPVRKIAATMARRGWKISPAGFKTIAHPNAEERAALKRYLLVYAAEYSLTVKAIQHRLVFFYLETILKRDGEKDPVLQRKIKKVLDAATAARQKKGVQPCGTTTKK